MEKKLIKATAAVCEKCMYRSGADTIGCNYLGITGKTRVVSREGMKYDPEYCDKFEQGSRGLQTIHGWKGNTLRLIPHNEWPLGYNPYQE